MGRSARRWRIRRHVRDHVAADDGLRQEARPAQETSHPSSLSQQVDEAKVDQAKVRHALENFEAHRSLATTERGKFFWWKQAEGARRVLRDVERLHRTDSGWTKRDGW